ncbi:MAG TPA: sigma-54 dependent transcriptional regulator [Blastocatellia bacterium]|nr:sigma-54 dependent transcriptional regulator [Blastocatellia bacterium]
MGSAGRILVVDDESSVTDALALILGDRGYEIQTAGAVAEAVELLARRPVDLVLTDLRLSDSTGLELLTRIKQNTPETEVILMTAHGSLDVTIDAIKKGAYYYLEKPFTPDQVLMLVERAIELASVKRENRALKRTEEARAFGMVGRTPKMLEIYETIRATAPSEASVLIEGESGTGKELIASAFHSHSNRARAPFVRINCAAIPRDLIESELFGYKKGAFTGADRDKRGLIEAASGGTLLLDEVAEMPAHLQTKLLRVLQDRRVRRVGDEQEIGIDFRLVAATNRSTAEAMKQGVLREDLYFRISTIKITVPPLRERLDDLPLLAEEILQRYAGKYGKVIRGVSQAAYSLLSRYDWPGNVRELESVIERAVLFCPDAQLGPEHLPDHLRSAREGSFRCEIPPYLTLEEIEREAIEQTLERTGGNVKKTAQILNMHRPTLYRKLRRFGLKRGVSGEDETISIGIGSSTQTPS